MSAQEISTSLASKIEAANLTDDEANLLVSLIEGGDEVEGFVDKSSPKLTGFNIGMPPRIKQEEGSRWIDVLSTDWGVQKPRS